MAAFNPYAVDLVAGETGSYLVMCRGAEVGVAPGLDEAADMAAADAMAGYPHAGLDLLGEAAARTGRPLVAVVGTPVLFKELSALIAEGWEVRFPAPRP